MNRVAAIVIALLLGGLVLACDLVSPPGEVATAKLYVDPGPAPNVQDLAVAESALMRYAERTKSDRVLRAVIAKLGLDERPEDLQGAITTQTSTDDLLLTIEVRDKDPEAARVLALALGDEMITRSGHSVVEEPVERGVGPEAQRHIDELFEDVVEPTAVPMIERHRLVWFERPAASEATGA